MINLTVVIDNDEALKKLKQLQTVAKQTTSSVVSDAESMDAVFDKIKGTLAGIASAAALKEFVGQIVKVRGEVQQLEVAFETMLGSKQKSDRLMGEVIDLAAKTPFGLQDVSNATKMLLAYGSSAESVGEEIKMLGNIASGLSIPLNDMIYLYGTTRTQGRMFTQDLRQFMGRGIPLAEELAKQFGVTKNEVGELVTAGKVGFDEMAKALQSMTSEGGQFNNLMEKQSQTISGQISNLEDGIYQMFNNIGKSNQDTISGAISLVSLLVENYERVGRSIAALIAIYGTYKAAVMAYNVVSAIAANAALGMTVAEQAKTVALIAAEKVQKLYNATLLKNPYVLVATLIAAVVAAIVMQKNETERLREAEEEYAAAKDEIIAKEEEHKRKIEELANVAGDESRATEDRRRALVALEMQYPAIFAKYDTEAEKLANIKSIKEEIAALDAKNSITNAENELASVEKRIEELEGKERPKTTYSRSLGITPTGGGLSNKEKAELKNLQNRREELKSQLFDNHVTDIVAGVENLSDGLLISTLQQLKAEQSRRNRVSSNNYGYSAMGGNSLVDDLTSTNVFTGWTDDQIQAYIQRIEGEKSAREQEKYTVAQLKKIATDKVAAAEKALADFDASEKKGDEQTLKAERQKLVEAIETAKDEAKKVGVTSNKKTTGGSKSTTEDKQKRELFEARQLTEQLTQENIDSEIALMDDGTEKKLAQIDNEWEKRKAAIKKNAEKLSELQGGILTEEQQQDIDKAYSLADEQRNNERANVYREEFAQMQDFLEQYGTFHQRKLAIAEEYNKRIAEAQSPTEILKLEGERDRTLASLNAEEIAGKINWEIVFGDLGGVFTEYLRPEFEALSEYLNTEEFKNADASSKKTITDAYNKLKEIFGDGGGPSTFEALGSSVERLEAAQTALINKQKQYTQSYNNLIAAQDEYTSALESGDEKLIELAELKLGIAQYAEQNASSGLAKAQEEYNDAQEDSVSVANRLQEAMEGTISGLKSLSSATIGTLIPSLKDTAEGLAKFGGKFGEAIGNIADKLGGKTAGIIDFVLQIVDLLKDGISGLIIPIIDAVFSAVTGILGDVLNFRDGFFVKLGESLFKGIMGIFKSILTLGGWFDWIGNGQSDPKLEADLEQLSEVNKSLQISIDRLGDKISDVTELYNAQKGLLNDSIRNTEEMARRSLQASSNGFFGIGGTKSTATKISEGMSAEDWQRISEVLGKQVNHGWDFSRLGAEDMLKIYDQLPDLWGKLISLANDGYQDSTEYLQNLVDLQMQLEDLEKQIKEDLTGVSFEAFREEFKNALLDMEVTAEDFADNFNKMLVESIASSLITSKYNDKIKALYNDWAAAMEDKTITDAEREDLERQREELYNEIAGERKVLQDMLGYDSASQSASSKGFQAMSQDTGDELNGRFTDIQGKTTAINEAVQFIKGINKDILNQTTSISQTLASIHNDTSLIEKHTRVLGEMNETLNRIKLNTAGLT